MSNIYDDYKPYIDHFGLTQPHMDNGDYYGMSGNGLLYTSHYILALVDNNALTSQEKIRLLNVYESCKVPDQSGIYNRTPTKVKDLNSWDDIYGILLASKYLDDGFTARRIYDHGQSIIAELDTQEINEKKVKQGRIVFNILKLISFNKVKHVWHNVNPLTFNLSAWQGRRPDVIATIRMAAGKPVGLFHWIYWAANLLGAYFQDRSSNHNAFILRYTGARAVEGYGFMTDLVIKLFKLRFRKVWGNLAEVKAAYYNNPNHPDAVHLKNTK